MKMKRAKLNRAMEIALERAISEELIDTNVSIYEKGMYGEDDKAVEFEISWKTLGSVSPEEAEIMARNIQNAVEIVNYLNAQQIYYTHEADGKVDEMLAQGDVEGANSYLESKRKLFRLAILSRESFVLDTFRK